MWFPLDLLQEGCTTKIFLHVYVHTLPGGLQDCDPYSLGWVGRLLIVVDHADDVQTSTQGREVPPQVLPVSVSGFFSAVPGSKAQGPWLPLFTAALHEEIGPEMLHDVSQTLLRYMFKPIFLVIRVQKIIP